MDTVEKRARELLARCLDEWGYPCEAENVRGDEDLESYESELRLISQLLCFGMDTADGHERAALTPPEGYVPERSVLVAATRLRKLASAATPMARSAYIKAAELIEMAVVAARPDTPASATVTIASKGEAEELSRRRVARIEGAE